MGRFSRKKQGFMSATVWNDTVYYIGQRGKCLKSDYIIYIYSENRMHETDSLRQALKLGENALRGQRPVVSAVGAGGKTTTLHRLADEYVRKGIPVFVTTTTHIINEHREWFLSGFSKDKIEEQLKETGQVWVGEPAPGGKIGKLSDRSLDMLMKWEIPDQKSPDRGKRQKVPILIEADGAKRLPVKVPAEHEPVILPCTTHVLSLYGVDSVGQKIEETIFRPELAELLLKKNRTECVTEEDIARLAASDLAGRKGCPDTAVYTVILNKADDEKLRKTALTICRLLEKEGIRKVIVTGRRKS